MAYTQRVTVRFPDVDYARVVYYPRFFDYCHRVFEDFFTDEVQVPYVQMLTEQQVGYPSVHAEADFKAPLRFGDVARITLEVVKVSPRAATCRYRIERDADGTLCAVATVVVASVDMDSFSGTPMPQAVRAAFERHLVA